VLHDKEGQVIVLCYLWSGCQAPDHKSVTKNSLDLNYLRCKDERSTC